MLFSKKHGSKIAMEGKALQQEEDSMAVHAQYF